MFFSNSFVWREDKAVVAIGNWTVCVPLKYLVLMPDIQEAICFKYTALLSPLGAPRGGGKKNVALRSPPPLHLSLYTPLSFLQTRSKIGYKILLQKVRSRVLNFKNTILQFYIYFQWHPAVLISSGHPVYFIKEGWQWILRWTMKIKVLALDLL